MGILREGRGKGLQYDLAVAVPYDKTGEGEVKFYLRWVPVMRRTETAPEEGGHWETAHIDGFHYDDDLPDLEEDAFVLADEVIERYGFSVIFGEYM
jgi:hypothetical protein